MKEKRLILYIGLILKVLLLNLFLDMHPVLDPAVKATTRVAEVVYLSKMHVIGLAISGHLGISEAWRALK